MKPNTTQKMEAIQRKQKSHHDAKAKTRVFNAGDYIRNYLQGDKWVPPGVVAEKTGPQLFVVKLSTGRSRRCHDDQIRMCDGNVEYSSNQEDSPDILVSQSDWLSVSETNMPPPQNTEPPSTTSTSIDFDQPGHQPPGHPASALRTCPRYEPSWT